MQRKPMQAQRISNFRSGLEQRVAEFLDAAGISYTYEELVVAYVKPEKKARYTPDFVLPNGIIVECKGRFLTADRQKHLLVKQQHPELDIRFLFSNARQRISKQSKTRYCDWCDKHGLQWCEDTLPDDWLT